MSLPPLEVVPHDPLEVVPSMPLLTMLLPQSTTHWITDTPIPLITKYRYRAFTIPFQDKKTRLALACIICTLLDNPFYN